LPFGGIACTLVRRSGANPDVQADPYRTTAASRRRADRNGSHFIRFVDACAR